jgi:hypothetical protein
VKHSRKSPVIRVLRSSGCFADSIFAGNAGADSSHWRKMLVNAGIGKPLNIDKADVL